ncbi:MAG: GyrI-like domain-containing protein [Ornithinimicrobium sp.]
MLRLRLAELEREESLARARLSAVESRLRLIEKEHFVSDTDYVVKSLPAVRMAAKSAVIENQSAIAEFVGKAFAELAEAVCAVGGSLDVAMASYDMREEGIGVTVGYGVSLPVPGAEAVDLPATPTAVCGVHLGSMDGIGAAWHELARWVESQGWAPSGPARENYVRAWPVDDQSGWVTELQQPVVPL